MVWDFYVNNRLYFTTGAIGHFVHPTCSNEDIFDLSIDRKYTQIESLGKEIGIRAEYRKRAKESQKQFAKEDERMIG